MRLTLYTDYALRVLMYAAVKGDRLSTIAEIVEQFDVSRGHLMKVVHRLGQKGYLETLRGRNGGIRLARPPDRIVVGAVIRDMEEELGVVDCLQTAGDDCRIAGCCVLQQALREATNAFLATLDGYTLDDLVKPRQALAALLALDRPLMRSDRAAAPA